MKKVLAIVLTLLVALSGCISLVACSGNTGDDDTSAIKGGEIKSGFKQFNVTLKVYTNAGFAPFEYVNDKGEVVGVDIDIMKKVAELLGCGITISDIDFDSILNEVENDKYAVGAAGMSKTAARDEVALASDVYATSVQYVIAPTGAFADGKVVTLNELSAYSKDVGVQSATTGQFLIEDSELGFNIIEYENAILASQDIGTTVDFVIIDELPAKEIAGADPSLSCWMIDAEPESYVLYFNKQSAELVDEVNKVLATLILDGSIGQYIVNHSNN